VAQFREALAAQPNELDAKLNLADALNCVMRIRTHGNIPLIEGTNDTEPHKKIWAQMGPETLALAEEVYQARPNDIRSLAVYTDAYMYRSSAWGIVNAVMKGAADRYVENAEAMTKKFPKYDSGLGHAFMGAFYLLAPWPLSDDEKARARMEAAHRIGPNSKRNNYYLGVVAYREGKFQEAIAHFEKATAAKCLSPAERDFCGFMKQQIRRGINRSKEQL
jgi:tetratricopeptide (TPR) repeat protein